MTDSRPNPIALAETLRLIPGAHTILGAELDRPAPASSRGNGDPKRVPLNQQILQQRLDITNFAQTYAHMIVEARGWNPPATDIATLIGGIIDHIGFFTEAADKHLGQDLAEEAETIIRRARTVILGDETHRNRIAPCREQECGGRYTLTWRDGGGSDNERMWRLRATSHVVHCDRDMAHEIEIRCLAVGA